MEPAVGAAGSIHSSEIKLESQLELALFESARRRVITAVERNRVGAAA